MPYVALIIAALALAVTVVSSFCMQFGRWKPSKHVILGTAAGAAVAIFAVGFALVG
jgi:hypothetical protein